MFDWQRIKQRAKSIQSLLVPLILYFGLLAFSVSQAPAYKATPWGYVIALLPMIPGVFIVLGILRNVRKLDEMERRIVLEAAAFGFTFTLFWLLSQGLLGLVGVPQPRSIFIVAVMSFLLVIGKIIGNRRYQ